MVANDVNSALLPVTGDPELQGQHTVYSHVATELLE